MLKKTIAILLLGIMLVLGAMPVFAVGEGNSDPEIQTVYEQNFDSTTINDVGLVDIAQNNPTTQIDSGRLVITAGGTDAWVGLPEAVPQNLKKFTLTFDMCNISLPNAGYHNGMAYRLKDTENFARATLRGTGQSVMNTMVGGIFKNCTDALSMAVENDLSASLQTNSAGTGITYHFKVVVTPDDVSVFIDDILASRRHGNDNYYSEGTMGFYVSKNCSVAFDNIKIEQKVYNYEKGDIVYSEDFTGKTSTDISVSGTGSSLDVADERLVVTAGSADAWVTLPDSFDTSMKEFIFEAEMTNIAIPANGYHNGIVYRFAGTDDFERATMRAWGQALMDSKVGKTTVGASKGGGSTLSKDLSGVLGLDGVKDRTELSVGITYKLRVEVGENETVFYVNGIYAGTRKAVDSKMSSGKLGFYVSKSCVVAFDNIKVTYGDADFELGIQDSTGSSSPENETGKQIIEEKQELTQITPNAEEYVAETEASEKGCGSSLTANAWLGAFAVVIFAVILIKKKERTDD